MLNSVPKRAYCLNISMRQIHETEKRLPRFGEGQNAIARTVAAIIIIAVVVVGAIATGVLLLSSRPSPTSTSSSFPSSSSASSSGSSSTSRSATSAAPQALVMDDSFWPYNDLNDMITTWPNWLLYTVYQPLIIVNETALYQRGVTEYLPVLATGWNVSTDGTTYTFNLRQNVTFSDGNPFNSYEIWAWDYGDRFVLGNSSILPGYNIFNMSNVNFGPATIALLNQSGLINPSAQALNMMSNRSWPIYVSGPYQISYKISNPFPWFLSMLIGSPFTIHDVQWMLHHGGFGAAASPNTYFNQHPVPGTGPYVVTGVSENSYVTFSQNPTYWGLNLSADQIQANPFLDPGHVKKVLTYYKSDDLARYTDLSSGSAQVAVIESADWNLITANPKTYSYFTLPPYSALQMLISMNTKLYPTNITDVRQAIVHAINYTNLINKAFHGQASEIVPPQYPVFKDYYNLANLTPYQYNPTVAKQYLDKANITNMPTLIYKTPNSCPPCVTIGEVIQSDLGNIGITVNIEVQTFGTYIANWGSYSFDLNNTANEGHITVVDGSVWAPSALTPADAWIDFVGNGSLIANTAVYYNPLVQNAVDSFFSGSNTTYIQSQIRQAQIQVYNDAPLVAFKLGLWTGDGSLVWHNNVVKSFLVDPYSDGLDTLPIFNTMTFG